MSAGGGGVPGIRWEAPRPGRRRRWPWALAMVLVVTVDVLLFGFRTGECLDYTAESGADSTCASGPVLGLAGTWLLAVVSFLVITYLGRRFMRASRHP